MSNVQRKEYLKSECECVKTEKKKQCSANNCNQNSSSTQNSNQSNSSSPNNCSQSNSNDQNSTSTSISTETETLPAGEIISQLLSNSHARCPTSDTLTINGKTYKLQLTYRINKKRVQTFANHSLIDQGANGGFAGSNMQEIALSDMQKVDVVGIKNTKCNDLPVGTFAGKIITSKDPIIGIFHQYAYYGKGNTIHSPLQMEAFGQIVSKKPKLLGGQSMIQTLEGHEIPLSYQDGLPYVRMSKPTKRT